MKLVLVAAAAFSSATLASKHGHAHQQVHRAHARELAKKDIVQETIEVTVTECWLDDSVISPAECDQGVRNGTLKFIDEGYNDNPPPLTTFLTITATATPAAVATPKTPYQDQPTTPSPEDQSTTLPTEDMPAPAAAEPAPATNNTGSPAAWASGSALSDVSKEFPDGQLDCTQFPSEYGAIPLDWLELGGWASVQKPNQDLTTGYNDILTVTKAQCKDSTCCLEGSFCSYACPVGYLKYQWPTKQGATGQSIGGLYCQNGKLHLTNPGVKTLCAEGSTDVKVNVRNTLSQNVAICRTNYPGDEKMSIPVNVNPGETKQLACPDSANYYKWLGQDTSAQYYINMPGYSVEKACVWGDFGDDFGNWAPGNLGVGWSNGRAWLSIAANHPTQTAVTLPYTIELVGGDTKCKYSNGQYCTGNNYEQCSTEGCTVSAADGVLTYILS